VHRVVVHVAHCAYLRTYARDGGGYARMYLLSLCLWPWPLSSSGLYWCSGWDGVPSL
jgi:hypothetical protein